VYGWVGLSVSTAWQVLRCASREVEKNPRECAIMAVFLCPLFIAALSAAPLREAFLLASV